MSSATGQGDALAARLASADALGRGIRVFSPSRGLARSRTASDALVLVPTALVYRVATFYLPPIWEFFAMRWLQRNELV